MRVKLFLSVFTAVILTITPLALAQEDIASVINQITWQPGPSTADLGDVAEIFIPEGYFFAGPGDTRRLLAFLHHSTKSKKELGILTPDNLGWLLLFEYLDAGYIKFDEDRPLDPDAVMKTLREYKEEFKGDRSVKTNIVDWVQPPEFNPDNHGLEWSVRGDLGGVEFMTWSSLMFGRRGLMKITLDTVPENMEEAMTVVRGLLAEFTFKPGQQYTDYQKGDEEAEFDLVDVVTGRETPKPLKPPYRDPVFLSLMAIVAVISIPLSRLLTKWNDRRKK